MLQRWTNDSTTGYHKFQCPFEHRLSDCNYEKCCIKPKNHPPRHLRQDNYAEKRLICAQGKKQSTSNTYTAKMFMSQLLPESLQEKMATRTHTLSSTLPPTVIEWGRLRVFRCLIDVTAEMCPYFSWCPCITLYIVCKLGGLRCLPGILD